MLWIIIGVISSYLIGSVPTAYIFVRLLKKIDIRSVGSGNVGATNAMRVLGKSWGLLVLFLDVVKGVIPVVFLGDFVAAQTGILPPETVRIIFGVACIAGHNWTVFLNFKGGKGVATGLGVFIGLSLRIAGLKAALGLVILIWLIVFLLFMIISLASVIAAASLPVVLLIFNLPLVLILAGILLSAFVVIRHRGNIKRLLQGKEPRIKFRK
jgi:glycerol-3-phosphate acyltransferase PlsY